MNPKPRPNRLLYIRALQAMTPEERVDKAFELTALVRQTLKAGIRDQFPTHTEEELNALYLERLAQCHNKNY